MVQVFAIHYTSTIEEEHDSDVVTVFSTRELAEAYLRRVREEILVESRADLAQGGYTEEELIEVLLGQEAGLRVEEEGRVLLDVRDNALGGDAQAWEIIELELDGRVAPAA